VLGNDYSIDPMVIGWLIAVHADLDTVTGRCDGLLVASHRRCWARLDVRFGNEVMLAQKLP
jgi:hypothetical protein